MGSKRNELSEEHINEIVRLYGDLKENDHVKLFDNEDFGYNKITVERPLRLNFKIDEERVKTLVNQTAFTNLSKSKKKGEAGLKEIEAGKQQQQAIVDALLSIQSDTVYKNREELTKMLKKLFKDKGLTIGSPLLKAILNALSEKDETADICVDGKGNPEPDTDLRDTESVPLKEDIYEYFEREIKPHVPDAWIDESKTKVGYEIPFTRHFYQYTALRSSEIIKEEIKALEESILEKLKKVMG